MPRQAILVIFVAAAVLSLGGLRVLWSHRARAEPAPFDSSQKGAFASERQESGREPAPFDAKRAMTYLETICKIGPRISATEGMKKQQELVQKHFESCGGQVELQRFTAQQLGQKKPVPMANMVARWFPERPRRVILCSHYDTRPIADQEPNPGKWRDPFVSANDGGSGVALLMELANSMKDLKTEVGVDFVLFDGEEYVFNQQDKYFFGSEHFAKVYQQGQPGFRYIGAVLLDMIAGKEASIPAEQHSWFQARALTQQLWEIAQEQKCTNFKNRVGDAVLDDHLALNRAGIPAVDLIDFSYAHWHRLSDVPANCSAESIGQVARVLSVWLQRVK